MEFHPNNEDHIKKLKLIQSHCRQKYVQSEMQKVRAQYEDIFKEIEGDDTDLLVVWPNDFSLCYPKFVSKKQAANSKPVNSKASSKLVDDRTFTCSNNENEGSSVMKFVPDHKKNEIKTIRFHDENYVNAGINKEQLNYLELDNLKKMPKNELINIRESVSLELLWIQQAIQSRVQYLKLKKNLQDQKIINQLSK